MSFSPFALLVTLLTLTQIALADTSFKHRKFETGDNARTVSVQLFEWPWEDVAKECESYLGPNNFAAVQVSPPYEHLVWEGEPWWERYQPISYKLNSRAGSEAQFKDMVNRCNAAGVDVYVDVVINHMAGMEEGFGHDGSLFTHYQYDGLYSYDDFHHCGQNGNDDIKDFSSVYELRNCELLNLADLNTGKESVQQTLADFLNSLLKMGVRGLRLDAAKHVAPEEIQQILAKLHTPVYIYQELILSPGEPVFANDYTGHGDITLFGAAFDIGRAFKNRNLSGLAQVGTSLGYVQSERAVVFLENHDLQRNEKSEADLLSYQREPELYSLAQVFLLGWPYGYPRVYSSYSFDDPEKGPPTFARQTLPVLDDRNLCRHPWQCEHRLPEVVPMVHFRNKTNMQFFVNNLWSNGLDRFSFGRGNIGHVVVNSGPDEMNAIVTTRLPQGQYCNILGDHFDLKSKKCTIKPLSVDERGRVQVKIRPYSALALLNEE